MQVVAPISEYKQHRHVTMFLNMVVLAFQLLSTDALPAYFEDPRLEVKVSFTYFVCDCTYFYLKLSTADSSSTLFSPLDYRFIMHHVCGMNRAFK